jgi:hypothetical protein
MSDERYTRLKELLGAADASSITYKGRLQRVGTQPWE